MAGSEVDAEFHTVSVVCEEGFGVVFDYQCCVIEDRHGNLCEIVPVCRIDTKLLVAVPFEAWHRTITKRLLPERALSKPVVVEVEQCAPYDRAASEAGGMMKIWMGFLQADLVNSVQEAGMEDVPVTVFADGEFVGYLPFSSSLEAAAKEHFAFTTATEGEQTERTRAVPGVDLDASGSGMRQEERLAKLETMM